MNAQEERGAWNKPCYPKIGSNYESEQERQSKYETLTQKKINEDLLTFPYIFPKIQPKTF